MVEFMGFASCLAYLTFLLIYFKEYERKQQIRQYSDLTKMQLLSIQKEIEQVKLSEQKIAIEQNRCATALAGHREAILFNWYL